MRNAQNTQNFSNVNISGQLYIKRQLCFRDSWSHQNSDWQICV